MIFMERFYSNNALPLLCLPMRRSSTTRCLHLRICGFFFCCVLQRLSGWGDWNWDWSWWWGGAWRSGLEDLSPIPWVGTVSLQRTTFRWLGSKEGGRAFWSFWLCGGLRSHIYITTWAESDGLPHTWYNYSVQTLKQPQSLEGTGYKLTNHMQ